MNITLCARRLLFVGLVSLASAQSEAPWQSLFNGQNLDGWSLVDPPLDAKVEDGAIVIHLTPHTVRHTFLRTETSYRDFIFEIEFKRDQAMDSGVMFRCESAPASAFSGVFGYMVKIDPQAQRRWTGGLFVDYGNGYNWLHSLADDLRAQSAEKPPGEWNQLRIETIGEITKIWLNNVPTVHARDDRYLEGFIALKIHFLNNGDPAKKALSIAYRHARIIAANPERFARPIDLPLRDTRHDQEVTYFR